MMGDFRGFCDAAGVWRPMGRWRGGVWNDGGRRPRRTRAPRRVEHPLTGVVTGHGIITTSDGQRVTMDAWSDAVQYDVGVSVTFGLSDGQAVSVRGAPPDKVTKRGDQRRGQPGTGAGSEPYG